eukprot:jgi/Psemu1/1326/gm1.1326_g
MPNIPEPVIAGNALGDEEKNDAEVTTIEQKEINKKQSGVKPGGECYKIPTNCQLFVLLTKYTQRMSYDKCATLHDAEVRREGRKEADLDEYFVSFFSVAACSMSSPHTENLDSKEEQIVAINSDEANSLLQEAFDCIGAKEEKSEFKQSILEVFIKTGDKHKNDQDKMDENEISLFT